MRPALFLRSTTLNPCWIRLFFKSASDEGEVRIAISTRCLTLGISDFRADFERLMWLVIAVCPNPRPSSEAAMGILSFLPSSSVRR